MGFFAFLGYLFFGRKSIENEDLKDPIDPEKESEEIASEDDFLPNPT